MAINNLILAFELLLLSIFGSNAVTYTYNVNQGNAIKLEFIENSSQVSYTIVRNNVSIQKINLGENFHRYFKSIRDDGFVLHGTDNSMVDFKIVDKTDEFFMLYVRRNASRGTVLKDCIDLQSDKNSWFGGPQQKQQYWPIDRATFQNYSYITKEEDNCAIAERYWLSSDGVFIYVEEEAPLFIDQNVNGNYLCLIAQKELPYYTHSNPYTFNYYIGVGTDPRATHMEAVQRFLGKPTGHPNERMVTHPVWSTWARYKRDINESVVLDFANEILKYKFNNSQFEIDDDWEICYGALEFRTSKFPNIASLVQTLKQKGFKVTLWIHPFINKGCDPWYSEAKSNGYLVADHKGNVDTQWWNSVRADAAYIDFTKPAAAKWFVDRLKKLLDETGIDSYKFDAGETSWTPPDPVLNAISPKHPLAITTDYVNTVSQFGDLVEVRSGFRNQQLPIFMRIVDKDSLWTFSNGLPTLVTTTLALNLAGYPLVLPDMIGGNGYGIIPDQELFIRWLQANVFMPSLQFSFVPWDYDDDTIEISQHYTSLHAQYAPEIMKQFKNAVDKGEPVNPPLWWIAPNDRTAHKIDDQFLLGEDIIVAPVMVKGAQTRHIYLPHGKWIDKTYVGNTIWIGPKWLMDYPAPLEILPYFVRDKS